MHNFEDILGNTPANDVSRVSVVDTFVLTYGRLMVSLLSQDKIEEALTVSNKGRARALAELLHSSYSVHCPEDQKANIFDECGIKDVAKLVGCEIMFFALDKDEIYSWVINADGSIKFKKKIVPPEFQSRANRTQLSHDFNLVQELQELISTARENRSPVKCEDRSLAPLYSSMESIGTEDELTSELSSVSIRDETAGPDLVFPFSPPSAGKEDQVSE